MSCWEINALTSDKMLFVILLCIIIFHFSAITLWEMLIFVEDIIDHSLFIARVKSHSGEDHLDLFRLLLEVGAPFTYFPVTLACHQLLQQL